MFPMLRVGFALLFGLMVATKTQAQQLTEAAAPLAGRISSLLPRRATVSLEFQVLSPLAMAASSRFLSTLQDELRKTGMDVTAAAQAESRLRVVVSDNPRGLLFVAELTGADNSGKAWRQVVMLPWSGTLLNDAKPAVRLVAKAVWEQAEPVLDLLLLDSESQLLVLSPARAMVFHAANGTWTLTGQSFLSLAQPATRDPRGRVEFVSGTVRAFLPGTSCMRQTSPPFALVCGAASETWLLNPRDPALAVRWVADRNVLEADGVRSGFYSSAAGLFASTNQRVEDRSGKPVPGTDAWGSDVAAIENTCSSGTVVVAAMAGDSPEHDQVEAFEMVSGQPVARSEALPLPGSVTALWPAETAGQATLVVRNSKTGNYEASRLALACAH
jgi:hypothetical protein